MKEISKVRCNSEEVKNAVKAICKVDETLNVLDVKVYPYSYGVPIRQIVDNAKRFDGFTRSSQQILVAELNGCINTINSYIRLHNEKDVTIKMLLGAYAGQIKVYKESVAKLFLETGYAELV